MPTEYQIDVSAEDAAIDALRDVLTEFGNIPAQAQTAADSADASAIEAQTAADSADASAIEAGTSAQAAASIVELAWSARDLLRDGETGVYLMPLDPAAGNVWTDTARTVRATTAGQRVAAARLATESGFLFAEQATLSDLPYLGRYPFGGRRNLLVNTALTDAVVGTPGTLANSWGVAGGTGMNVSVAGAGVDAEGIPYNELRVQGTPGSNFVINFCGTTDVPVTGGETYTWSVKTAIVAGSPANITNMNLQLGWRTVAGALLQAAVSPEQLKDFTSYGVRSFTAAAPTGLASPVERVNAQLRVNGSGPVDFTIRLGGMSFEHGDSRARWQKVTRAAGIPYGLDVTEAGRPDVWYLWRSDASDSLTVTLPDLGSNVTVSRAESGSQDVLFGQTVSAGPFQLLGSVGSRTVNVSLVSRQLSDAESGLLERWQANRRGEAVEANTPAIERPPGAVSLYDLGYLPTDGDVRTMIAAAKALSNTNTVIIPYHIAPWISLGTLELDCHLDFEPGAIIAQNHTAYPGVAVSDGITINRANFTSTVYNQQTMAGMSRAANSLTHSLGRRAIRVDGPNVSLLNVQNLSYMAGGIICDQPNLTVTGLRCRYLRSIEGWAAAVNLKNGCTNFYIEVDTIEDCDRALEPEDGASDGLFKGKPGNIRRVWSRWDDASDGTPEESFCISVHSHIDAIYGICKNIRYDGFTLIDCVNPVLMTRSNATADKMPQSCVMKNITVVNTDGFPATRQGSAAQVRIEANDSKVEVGFINLRSEGIHSTLRGQIVRGVGNSLTMTNTDGVAAIPWLSVSTTAESSRVEVSALAVVVQPSVPADASQSHLIDVDGPGTTVHIKARNVQNRGYVRFGGNALGSRVVNPDLVMPTVNAPNAAVRFSAASYCSVLGGRYVSSAGLSQLARLVSASQRNVISSVIVATSGSFATFDAPDAINNLITGNSLGAATITGTAGNTVANNV